MYLHLFLISNTILNNLYIKTTTLSYSFIKRNELDIHVQIKT